MAVNNNDKILAIFENISPHILDFLSKYML